jgi:glycine cleavage system aminomethyltransferase T
VRFLIGIHASFASRWKKRQSADFHLEKVALSEIACYPKQDKVVMLLRREDGAEMHIELHGPDAENFLKYSKEDATPKQPVKMMKCNVCDGDGFIADLDNIHKRDRCGYCGGAGRRPDVGLTRMGGD